MRRAPGPTFALLLGGLILLGGGCGPSNDLGSSCQLKEPICTANCNDPATRVVTDKVVQVPANATSDYIATGTSDCEDFTCIDTAGDNEGAYCSRRCIDNASCTGGVDKNLVCRTLVLDDAFINELRQALGDTAFKQLFGDIQTAKYCAHPLPK